MELVSGIRMRTQVSINTQINLAVLFHLIQTHHLHKSNEMFMMKSIICVWFHTLSTISWIKINFNLPLHYITNENTCNLALIILYITIWVIKWLYSSSNCRSKKVNIPICRLWFYDLVDECVLLCPHGQTIVCLFVCLLWK